MNKIKIYLNYLVYLICLVIPKRKNRWVFGAWFGNRVSDNPYALYQYVAKNRPDIEAYWICNDVSVADKYGINAVKRNTARARWLCLTAKVSVMNQGYLDLGGLNWVRRSFKVQLWHGVAWKKIGEDTPDTKTGLLHKISHKAYLFSNKCDLYIAPSDDMRKTIKTAFLVGDDKVLSAGQPRNEALLDAEFCKNEKDKFLNKTGAGKIILYMPTFRDKTSEPFTFMQISDDISAVLEKYDAVILEKQHYVQLQRDNSGATSSERIINVSDYDAQELLSAADILVTDYSSCFFDFVLRDKPVIHFMYDYDTYRDDDRGFYYDADYVRAGSIVKTSGELVSLIDDILNGNDPESGRRKIVRDRFDTYESADNSKIIVEEVLKRIHVV
ncbi:MAG: CDP-glycerol glycerophosphotransferase family protein [Clostridiales bacterium]|nr:CDP-glycerol glycerophosphotransferase family protein [Clostridiales bacterium]